MNTIQKEISKGGQSTHYVHVVNFEGVRIRISIKSDSYNFQSYARAEVWSPSDLKWNNVASLHHAQMATPHKLAYAQDGLREANYKADADKLLTMARGVIGL